MTVTRALSANQILLMRRTRQNTHTFEVHHNVLDKKLLTMYSGHRTPHTALLTIP
jgi:hypothetical protein